MKDTTEKRPPVPSSSQATDQGSGQTGEGAGGAKKVWAHLDSDRLPSGGNGQATMTLTDRSIDRQDCPRLPTKKDHAGTRKQTKRKKKAPNMSPKPGQNSLNILHMNVSGLSTKKVELAKTFHDQNIHIAVLQETQHQTADPYISGFTSYKCKCQECRGVLTYIRNDITGRAENLTSGSTDMQEVTVWWNHQKYYILNVYSPPGTTCSIPHLQETIYSRTIVCGDFNSHSPRWGYRDLDDNGRYIEELVDSSNLILVQNKDTPATLLHRVHKTLHRPDLTMISADIRDSTTTLVTDDMGSDHKGIIIQIDTPPK